MFTLNDRLKEEFLFEEPAPSFALTIFANGFTTG